MGIIKEGSSKGIKKWYQVVFGNRATDIFILVILAIIGHRGWFKPGMLDYGDIWAIPEEVLREFFSLPAIWVSSPQLGTLYTDLFKYPIWWVSGAIVRLGFNYSICQRVVYFFPYLFFAVFSIYYFTYVLFKKRIICFFATMFFVFNTFILQLAGGIIDAALAYALCPLILAFFIKGLYRRQFYYSILAGVILAFSIVYYPTAAYLTIGVILLFFMDALISQIKTSKAFVKKEIIKLAGYLLSVFIIPVVLNFYWILPSLLVKGPTVNPAHASVGWAYALSYAKLTHAISIYNVWWPPGSTGVQPVQVQYYLVPLLVLIGILSGLKDRRIRLLAIIAVLSVFFAKGTNKPFGGIYAWFFKYFPGGSMFRTPGKFHCLTNMAYAPLLGVGVEYIANRLRKIQFKRNILDRIFLVFIFCFLLYLAFPAFAGRMVGTFIPHQIPGEYETIKSFIKSQPPHFRTFWRPMKGRYAFYNQEYPLLSAYHTSVHASENSRYFLAESYNPQAFEETRNIAKILGILNVKYCFLPQEKEYLFRGKEFYLRSFEEQAGLKKISLGHGIDVFENEYGAPRFFATEHSALVIGGRKALFLLASLEGMNLSHWAIFFADQLEEKSRDLLKNSEMIVFYDKNVEDLALALLGEDYRVDLTKYVIPRSDSGKPDRWVKQIYSSEQTFDGAIIHSPKGVIYRSRDGAYCTASELNTPIPFDTKESDNYEIWLRPVTGPTRGKISISVSKDPTMKVSTEQILREQSLKAEVDSFEWIKVGSFYFEKGRHFFQITHHPGPIGIVDQFIIVPKRVIDNLRQEIEENLQTKDIVIIKEPESLSFDIALPYDGRYSIAANIGNYDFNGGLNIDINGNRIKGKKTNNKDGSLWVETRPVSLKKGVPHIDISREGNAEIELNQLVLFKTNLSNPNIAELFKREETVPVIWKMINPTKYEVKLEIDRPAYLIFSEGFNPGWFLNLKEPLHSINAYTMLNSFFINQPGEIRGVLEFSPQRYVYKGLWVSGIGLLLICGYLAFAGIASLKNKDLLKRDGK